jgi:protein involved in polysaccharide export with SLBB domain
MNSPALLLRIPLLLGAMLLTAAARPASAQNQTPPPPATLRPGDALLIRIDHVGGGIPPYRDIVDSDGRIEMPFLGFLHAEGKSVAEVEAGMIAAYAEARLSTNAAVRITVAAHFEPPPDRETLIRTQAPRRPVPAAEAFPDPAASGE